MLGRKAGWVVSAILVLLWGYGIYSLATSDSYQWDFKTYYHAAEAHARGLDWWDPAVLSQVAQIEIKLAYVYPPASIWLFQPFTWFNYDVAYQIWLFLKLFLLAVLIFLWYRIILTEHDLPLFLLFVTLAFGSAAYWDLVAGNIGIVEQAVIWLAIWALLKDRLWLFVVGVLLVSLFKLTFIAFLLLPLLLRRGHSYRPILAGGIFFVAYLAANQILSARESSVFWSILRGIDERGEAYNHSLLAFCRDIWEAIARPLGAESTALVGGSIVFAVAAFILVVLSWRWWKNRETSEMSTDPMAAIALFCVTYALIMPRMKTYSLILLIPPTWYVIRRSLRPSVFVLLFLVVSLTKWTPLPVPDLARLLWWYYPWLTALLIWGVLLTHKSARTSTIPS